MRNNLQNLHFLLNLVLGFGIVRCISKNGGCVVDTLSIILRLAVFAVLPVSLLASQCPRKVVALGWEFHRVSPETLFENADAFEKTGLDGVEIALEGRMPDGRPIKYTSIINGFFDKNKKCWIPLAWKRSMFEHHIPILKKITARRCFKHCFLQGYRSPQRYGRLDWRDDAGWKRVANNMAILASIARDARIAGITMDCEDYFNQRQYDCIFGDPEFDEASKLARRRGREVFEAAFNEYPSLKVLSFWLLSMRREYAAVDDPIKVMRDRGDLWPAFVNGILDAMPPEAILIDGDECAYGYEQYRNDFAAAAFYQAVKARSLVAPENLDKYARQVRTGFGLYMDRYLRDYKINFYGGIEDSAIVHFRRNLSSALEYAGEYVWLWGEQQSWIRWKKAPSQKRVNRNRTWEDDMPGLAEAISSIKKGDCGLEEVYRMRKCAGALTNLVADASCYSSYRDADAKTKSINGGVYGLVKATVKDVNPGDWYVVEVSALGANGESRVRWKNSKGWNLSPGERHVLRPQSGSQEWRSGCAFVKVPPGANELIVVMESRTRKNPDFFKKNGASADKDNQTKFDNIAVYKLF